MDQKKSAAELMEMSIAQLAKEFRWPKQTREAMVCEIHGCKRMSALKRCSIERQHQRQVELNQLQAETSLRHVLDYLEAEYAECYSSNFHQKYRCWIQRIVGLGLTRLDSIVLPQQTVTVQMLKNIPRDKLLDMDARILGTLSTIMLEKYRSWTDLGQEVHAGGLRRRIKELSPFPTIRELLAEDPHPAIPQETVLQTVLLLKELGFSYEDGLLMQYGTQRYFVEQLMKEELLDFDQATLFARIALKRGWEKLLLPEVET